MKVLLGIGGSEDSFRALEKTLDRVAATGDELTVAVLENPDSEPSPSAVVDRARDAVASSGIDAEVRRLDGDPGARLVEFAERERFDAIALGGGEESPMGKITLGSITEFVVLNATVTVILVR